MHGKTEDDVYWITEPAQIECLMSARRLNIVDQLANVGPRSIREIAEMMGVKPSSLYHHMALLVNVGLIESAGTRTVNRRQEKLYKTPAPAMRYGLSLDDPEARDLYRRLGAVQTRQTARDLSLGIQSDAVIGDGPARNLRIFRLVGAPDPEAMAKINHHIEELAKIFWASTGKGYPLVVMSAIVAPIPEDSAAEDDD